MGDVVDGVEVALGLGQAGAAACLAVLASVSPAPSGAQPTDSALLSAFRWRNIGPASIGGRITDIEAVDTSFRTVYVAAASGGVFKSVNAGTT